MISLLKRLVDKLVGRSKYQSNESDLDQMPLSAGMGPIETSPENPPISDELVTFDEDLLEKSRTQWQFGDWETLITITREQLQHHPDRAKIALLVAAGHSQCGDIDRSRQFARLAEDWGCSRRLVTRILISGVHNSLGRAAAAALQTKRALIHFESSIAVGSPSSDTRLITEARISRQVSALGLAPSTLGFNPWVSAPALKDIAQLQAKQIEQEKTQLQKQVKELTKQFSVVKESLSNIENRIQNDMSKGFSNAVKQLEAFQRIRDFLGTIDGLGDFHGWPISPDIGLFLLERMRAQSYDLIIEFGSGTSTALFARGVKALEQQGIAQTQIVTFEHDATYHTKTLQLLQSGGLEGRVRLVHAPLVDWRDGDASYRYYDCQSTLDELAQQHSKGQQRILVLVDGPPGATCQNARYPAVPLVFSALARHHIDVVLDDASRHEEKQVIELWKRFWEQRAYQITEQNVPSEKGIYLAAFQKKEIYD